MRGGAGGGAGRGAGVGGGGGAPAGRVGVAGREGGARAREGPRVGGRPPPRGGGGAPPPPPPPRRRTGLLMIAQRAGLLRAGDLAGLLIVRKFGQHSYHRHQQPGAGERRQGRVLALLTSRERREGSRHHGIRIAVIAGISHPARDQIRHGSTLAAA